jgi:hypothetical protein
MSPRGFWAERHREGQEDARLLLADRLHALRQEPYDRLLARAARDEEVEAAPGPSGGDYRLRTRVQRRTHGGEELLGIRIRVDDGSFLGKLNPLAETTVSTGPDGDWTGDYTLAGEGNDPRRYRLPGER